MHPILRAALAPLLTDSAARAAALEAIKPLRAFDVKVIQEDGVRHTFVALAPSSFSALGDAIAAFPQHRAVIVRPAAHPALQ